MADAELQTTTSAETPTDKLEQLGDEIRSAQVGSDELIAKLREYTQLFIVTNGYAEYIGISSTESEQIVSDIAQSVGQTDPAAEQVVRGEVEAIARSVSGELPATSENMRHEAADPVTMFNGEFVHRADDLRVAGAGLDFAFRRTYKSQVAFSGPLGANWDHNYHIYLRESGGQYVFSTGDLREETYTRHPLFGQAGFTYFVPPDGIHAALLPAGTSFVRRSADGTRHLFEPDPDWPLGHRLHRIEDRFGNFLALSYLEGHLDRVQVNHPDRVVRFEYDADGRIITVQDHTLRTWSYSYDDWGDLVAVTSPPTDNYPEGLVTQYDYSSAFMAGPLQHNLTRITDPAGQVYLETEYGGTRGDTSYNKVIHQRQGRGDVYLEYERVLQEFEHDYTDAERPVFQTNFFDRNGHPIHYVYNAFGNLVLKEETILQEPDLRTLTWRYRYNRDGALTASLSPEGVLTQAFYGRDAFLQAHGIEDKDVATHPDLTVDERLGFGSQLAVVRRHGVVTIATLDLAEGVWGDIFPDVIGALDPADAVVKFTYEPGYGQLLTASDPRFTTRADPNFAEPASYDSALTRYAYTGPAGDPSYFLAEVRRPDPTWPDGSQPGPVVERYLAYDLRGRLLRRVDPAGTITEFDYFTAPDGLREGFLRRMVVDTGGLALTTEYEVDPLGRVVALHEPRAVGAPADHFVTRYEFNALDQVTRITSSAPFRYETRLSYDPNGNLTRKERDAKDDLGHDIPGAPEIRTFCYDEQLHAVRETIGGVDLTAHLVTRNCWNESGDCVLTVLPAGNRISRTFDERHQCIATSAGAGTADAATVRAQFDGDGHQVRTLSARGYVGTIRWDTFGRVVEQHDPLGNVIRRNYDKGGNLLVERVFELRKDGSYQLLTRREVQYDLLGRPTTMGWNLFDDPLPAASLDDDFLPSPGPGRLLVAETYFDSEGRLVRLRDQLGHTHSYEYDAAGRLRVETDANGNRAESGYDLNGYLIRRDIRELVRDAETGVVVSEQVFASSRVYDQLNRLTVATDSLGNTTAYTYDSRNLNARVTDPLGNVTLCEHDIFGRLTRTTKEMTSTGLGGGGPSSPIVISTGYDPNGNLVAVTDSLGRITTQGFDALDRRRVVQYPDLTHLEFSYDRDSNLLTSSDAKGLVLRYNVDAVGRTVRIDVDRARVVPGVVIEGANVETYEYDPLGRLREHANDFADVALRTNSLGWVTRETLSLTTPAAPFVQPLELERSFDDGGAVVGLTYPGGRRLTYLRGNLGELLRIQSVDLGVGYPGSGVGPPVHGIADFEYSGRLRTLAKLGNGAQIAWRYDGGGRAILIEHRAAGPVQMLDIRQLFDGAGNVRLRSDATLTGASGESLKYDSNYRLTRVDPTGNPPLFDPFPLGPDIAPPPAPIPPRQAEIDAILGPLAQVPGVLTWEYDAAGNRLHEFVPAQPPVTYKVNALDQYTTVAGTGRVYDPTGNLLQDGQHEYRYDCHNRLSRVIDSATGLEVASFLNDAVGRRLLEIASGVPTHLVHDRLSVISEYRGGALFAQFVHDDVIDTPIQVAAEGQEHWYHGDYTRSVRVLTDIHGAAAAAYEYSPFGVGAGPAVPYNPHRYAARRLTSSLGSYDFRSRQYDPALGRFAQRDPAGMADGSNLYAYAANNPLTFLDPLGTAREAIDRSGAQLGAAPVSVTDASLSDHLPSPGSATSSLASDSAKGTDATVESRLRLVDQRLSVDWPEMLAPDDRRDLRLPSTGAVQGDTGGGSNEPLPAYRVPLEQQIGLPFLLGGVRYEMSVVGNVTFRPAVALPLSIDPTGFRIDAQRTAESFAYGVRVSGFGGTGVPELGIVAGNRTQISEVRFTFPNKVSYITQWSNVELRGFELAGTKWSVTGQIGVRVQATVMNPFSAFSRVPFDLGLDGRLVPAALGLAAGLRLALALPLLAF